MEGQRVPGYVEETSNGENDLAAAFARSLNVDAPVFVPTFGPPSATNNNGNVTTPSPQTLSSPAVENLPSNNLSPDMSPVDDWEANADEENNDEDDQDDLEEEEDDSTEDPEKAIIKPKATRKKGKVSESRDELDKKEHINIVFIGHVDAGKSTIGGQILFLTGMVDKRTLEKYEREAKEKNRESWYLSWALDTNQEERDKGKTVEVGRAFFTTEHKHFTLLDAPGMYCNMYFILL